MKSFGQRLKELRQGSGMSQRAFAENTALSFTYVSKLENGRISSPSAETIQKMSDVLGIGLDELLPHAGKVPHDLISKLARNRSALTFFLKVQPLNLSSDDREKDV